MAFWRKAKVKVVLAQYGMGIMLLSLASLRSHQHTSVDLVPLHPTSVVHNPHPSYIQDKQHEENLVLTRKRSDLF